MKPHTLTDYDRELYIRHLFSFIAWSLNTTSPLTDHPDFYGGANGAD